MKKKGLILKINNYFKKHPLVKNILSAVAVAVFGFILLNIAFLVDALFQNLIDLILRVFTPINANIDWRWFPPVKHFMFVVLICVISWFIFRSKLRTLFKAIYMTVPLAVVLVSIAILLYPFQILSYVLGFLFCLGVLYYFYKTKQPWLYYYTLILISVALLIMGIVGVEI